MPETVDQHLQNAVASLQKGDAAAAERALGLAGQAQPGHPDVLHLLGLVRHRQGRTAEAVGLVRQAVDATPGLLPYLVNLVALQFETGDADGACRTLEDAAARNPENADIYFQLGRVRLSMGDGDGALEALGRAMELAPDAPRPYGALGILYQQAGDFDAARAAYETAIELGTTDADDFFNLGTLLMNARDWPGALVNFARAAEITPEYQRAHANIGLIFSRNADYANAIAPLKRAVALNPDDGRSVNELIYALGATGDPVDGAELGLKYLKLHPEAFELYTQVGFAWMRAGRPEKAIEAANLGLRAKRHPTPFLAIKAAALNELGRRDAAAALLDFDRFLATKAQSAPDGYADIAAFNRDLVDYLLAHPSLEYSANNRSMEKGRGTLELFDGDETGPAQVLKSMILDMADDYLTARPADAAHPFLARRPNAFEVNCWGNVYDRDGRQLVHYHPTAYLSGVYYPSLPADMDPDEGGIEFGRAFHMFQSKDEPPVRIIRPREGMMVMFPSYFGHQTIPVTSSDQPRISFAFDLVPEGL
ncbi:MAG: tetratricopeptide repeat protein [Rhodospirillaceae bacterium]